MSYTISKTFSFAYGHRLTKDAGKCSRLHGHSAKAVVYLKSSQLNSSGMVYHFDDITKTLGKWITENLDHQLLLQKDDQAVQALESIGENFIKIDFHPTSENIAKMLYEKAKEMKLPVFKVEIWESETAKAVYEED